MREQIFVLKNKLGLHARPASEIVRMAARYKSEVVLAANGKTANAKSLILMLALGAKNGTALTLTVNGDDENEAFAVIGPYIAGSFMET